MQSCENCFAICGRFGIATEFLFCNYAVSLSVVPHALRAMAGTLRRAQLLC
jgi:hypothetical protein